MMHSQGKTSEDEEEEGQLLGTFSYDKSGPPIQEYTVHVCCSFHINLLLYKTIRTIWQSLTVLWQWLYCVSTGG